MKEFCIALVLLPVLVLWHAAPQIKTDSVAGSFSLEDLNGKPYSLEENLGDKLTVLLFWATWGHDSIEMLDSIEHLYRQFHDKGLNAIGVCVERQVISDSLKNKIIEVTKAKEISFPTLLDNQLNTFRQYGVIAVPTTVIIDKNKKCIYYLAGFTIIGREELFEFVYDKFYGKRDYTVHKRYEKNPDKKALRNYNLAKLKFLKGDLDTAKKYAEEAYNFDSSFVQPLLLLTEISIENKEIAEAEKYINRAVKIDSMSLEVMALSGLVYAKKEDTTKAIQILSSLIQKVDTFALAYCYIGYTFGVAGNIDTALIEFKKAEELDSAEFRIPKLRSEIYERFGKQQEAMQDKLKAKKLRRRF